MAPRGHRTGSCRYGRAHLGLVAALLYTLALALGCEDGAAGAREQASGLTPAQGGGPPMYVISTRVRNPDSDTSYLIAVPSLFEQPDVDLSSSLEVAGTARAYGPAGTGKIYLTSSEDGSMTEVSFDARGAATPGRVVSFVGLGVGGTSGGNLNAFLAPDKAYHINQDTLDVIVWDPESMAIRGSFPTGLTVSAEAEVRIFLQEPIVARERLLLISFEIDSDDITTGRTTLTVIDTVSDRVVSSETDARCSHFTSVARDSLGDLYFSSNWVHAANYFLFGSRAPHAPCMLRITAGETRFDPEWSRTLATELGTPIWSGVFPGAAGNVLVQGIAEDVVRGAQTPEELRSARPWTWYDVADSGVEPLQAEPTLEAPLALAGPVDGEFFLSSYRQDEGLSTLAETTAPGGIRAGIQLPGQIATVIRVR